MKTATLLRTIENEHAIQALYFMDPPFKGEVHVLASGIRTRLAHECFLFASDESGEITDWTELSGVRDTVEHAAAMADIGYEIVGIQ